MKISNHKRILNKVTKLCEEIVGVNNETNRDNIGTFLYMDGKQQMARDIITLIRKHEENPS